MVVSGHPFKIKWTPRTLVLNTFQRIFLGDYLKVPSCMSMVVHCGVSKNG
jgi:hypothetical protein